MIEIDQRPIGRTPRSNPATYTDLFTHIRELYSLTPDAKVRGYKPGRFSFNVKGGRCETCKGDGQIKIEMHFLPDVYVPCETCKGKRYNRETLEVRFKGKTIADVLEMSVEEALAFFAKIPKIHRRLQTLHDVGLDYMTLGQPATTLSGGEAQRVKLAAELCKVATGRTLYILDEPTTGLHFADIEKLLETLQRLVDGGNTMLVIEHNLDVIKQADYLVDLGPEGGEAGGEIVAVGTPEEVAQVAESYTGQFLRPLLAAQRRRRVNWRSKRSVLLMLGGGLPRRVRRRDGGGLEQPPPHDLPRRQGARRAARRHPRAGRVPVPRRPRRHDCRELSARLVAASAARPAAAAAGVRRAARRLEGGGLRPLRARARDRAARRHRRRAPDAHRRDVPRRRLLRRARRRGLGVLRRAASTARSRTSCIGGLLYAASRCSARKARYRRRVTCSRSPPCRSRSRSSSGRSSSRSTATTGSAPAAATTASAAASSTPWCSAFLALGGRACS